MAATVTVIVPVKDGGAELDWCVEAILDQDHVGPYDVVVIDNDSSVPVTARWGDRVRVVHEARPGSYAARNAGIAVATGDVLAFTDADCIPDRDWVRRGVQALGRQPSPAVVAGDVRLLTGDVPNVAELFDLAFGFDVRRFVELGFGATANLFVPRAVFNRIGTFDDTRRSGGDRDLCARASAAGFPFVFDESVTVAHPARASYGSLVSRARRVTGGEVHVHGRSSSRARLLAEAVRFMRPPIRTWPEIRELAPEHGWRRALSVWGVVAALRVVGGLERVRIALGGEAAQDRHVTAG